MHTDNQVELTATANESGSPSMSSSCCPTPQTQAQPSPATGTQIEELAHSWKALAWSTVACAVFGIIAWVLDRAGASRSVVLALYSLSYLAGGWAPAIEVSERLRALHLDVHFLMLAVALGAAWLGEPAEGAVLLFLFSLSGAMEHFAEDRTEHAISSLLKDAPHEATVLHPDGREERIPIDALKAGMVLRLRPGDRIPADARIVSGQTSVDESMLTGEATPISRGIGELIAAGSINLDGSVDAVATACPAESTLQRMVALVMEARTQRAPSQRLTDRFGSPYTWTILIGCTCYYLFLQASGAANPMYRAMTLLVVASPCALVLSIPSAILTAIAVGARRGILFRSGAAVETLAEVDTIVFDKTGTITTGELALASIDAVDGWTEEELMRDVAAAELRSEHPIARSLVREARRRGIEPVDPTEFKATPGAGVDVLVEGRRLRVGTLAFASELAGIESGLQEVNGHSHVHVYAAKPGHLARLTFHDQLRDEATPVISGLRAAGVTSILSSGDREEPVREVASAVGIDGVFWRQQPQDKVDRLRELRQAGRRVAMVGDGVNDAAALAAADVALVMGRRGSDAAIEEADIVLVGDRLRGLSVARGVSVAARRIIRQNLLVSIGTMATLAVVTVASAKGLHLTTAVVGHEGSTVVVVVNSLRLFLRRWNDA